MALFASEAIWGIKDQQESSARKALGPALGDRLLSWASRVVPSRVGSDELGGGVLI